jgi:hypothetical protein
MAKFLQVSGITEMPRKSMSCESGYVLPPTEVLQILHLNGRCHFGFKNRTPTRREGGFVTTRSVSSVPATGYCKNHMQYIATGLLRYKSKLHYDRQSVGQSALVSGTHLGPATNFFLLFSIRVSCSLIGYKTTIRTTTTVSICVTYIRFTSPEAVQTG